MNGVMVVELVGGPMDGACYQVPSDYTQLRGATEAPDDWHSPQTPVPTETHLYRMRLDPAGGPVTVQGRVMFDYASTRRGVA